MAEIRLNGNIADAVSEAAVFSAKAEGSAVTRRHLLPSYSEGSLAVTAAGVANGTFTRTAPCSGSGDAVQAVVNGQALSSVLASPGTEGVMELDDGGVRIRGKRGSVKLYAASREEASAFRGYVGIGVPASAEEPAAILPLGKLRRGIREVFYARSEKYSSGAYATSGVTALCEGGRLAVWALDSNRAARYSCSCTTASDCRCVIPSDIASFIASGRWPGAEEDQECRIYIGGNRFTLRAGPSVLSSPTVAGEIFDIGRITGRENGTSSFTFGAGELLRAANLVLSVAPRDDRRSLRSCLLILSASADGLEVSYSGPTGEVREILSAEAELSERDASAPGRRLGLNARLLRECLAPLQDAAVRMSADLSGGDSAVIFSPLGEGDEKRTHLLLPVFLGENRRS